ncbi:hypothetical protein OHD62_06985 [Mesorhizobium sp. YC-39]|uniref:hypothetical protein n=1 Tax=unclassified Mesorhizobium TaxID=325217 RepID=UPI0021E775E2|nr:MULTISPECIES: hypothetical protein [unclassified Mesorhizobium]MCV3205492.1 hypothetical protein [Mesorhizobium sp. YC-2]MCV3228109.1 hypothetical protein [Mesorhizobium sp. YC-39]
MKTGKTKRSLLSRGIDLRQSGDTQLCHARKMEMELAQLRTLLSVIVLIAASVVAGAGFAGQAPRTGANMSIATDGVIPSVSSPRQVQGDVMVTGWDNLHDDDCGPDCRPDCAHSTGSNCCAASISAGESGILHDARNALRFIAGRTFLATGIDPEALLHPPQTFA